MPITKNVLIRYYALDDCFRDYGRKYFIEDLVEACNEALLDYDSNSLGIEKRSVQYDLKFFEDSKGFNAPLEKFKEGRRVYYRYSDRKFSIKPIAIKKHEIDKLKETLSLISDFEGLPDMEWIGELQERLSQNIKDNSKNEKVIEFENNPYLTGKGFFSVIHESIKNKNVLNVEYQSFQNSQSKFIIIHPYYLKQYNTRWFLYGWNQELQKITNLAIDRIQNIDFISEIEYRKSDIEWTYYFEDVIGVTIPEGGEVQTIVLNVSDSLLPYLLTKPLHESQIHSKEKPNELKIKVIPNYELENKILGFGEQVEVKEPLSFREKVSLRINAMKNIYFTSEEEIENV